MQLEFPWRDKVALGRELEERMGLRLRVTVTDNASTVMSFKHGRRGQPAQVRVHHMFLSANPQVVRALADWLMGVRTRKAGEVLDGFIAHNQHLMRSRPRNTPPPQTRGVHFDLQDLFDAVNRQHFAGTVCAAITWGRMPRARRRRSIRFGSYSAENNLIRIHPLLDQAFVPEYFVRYITFHEMLHADLDIPEKESGRRRVHPREFDEREKAYPEYARAMAWLENPANLGKLLRPSAMAKRCALQPG